ncbi:MAG TPA: cytidylate kinase family protein [Candidatus Bathyarchaeia archaeon]|nr:cytidylate kinase family protein [Candidatus Bathyarchaeia archaeon]
MSGKEKTKSANEKSLVLCVSGMAGTGKSTLAKKLAHKYGLKYYSGGDALKALAAEEGYDTSGRGFWESLEGLRFLERREKDSKFDEAVDEKLLEYAKIGNVLLDSWTMPWLFKSGFKIWLLASMEKRAERVAKRDKFTVEEALQMLKEKEAKTKAIYKQLYGFNLGEDFKPFDLVLDTDNLTAEEVFQVLCNVIENVILRKKSS